MIRKLILFLPLLLLFAGCDSVYRYVFLPPDRVAYTVVPDKLALTGVKDTMYRLSMDGKTVVYDAKNWKLELRYMSDYQLNTFEFPDDSKNGEYSGNPYTFANWVDPKLGYTPRRFTVFKVSIYNYNSSKINFNPEASMLQTERGDVFKALAREKKNAKNFSIEEYFSKRKGTSGVDDDIYETRIGIARRTMLYDNAKPIYKGDSREGLIVYDPIEEGPGRLKVSLNKFILAYDENNEPAELKDLFFYFEQVPVDKTEQLAGKSATYDSTRVPFTAAVIKYSVQPGGPLQYDEPWNPLPRAVDNLLFHAQKNSKLQPKVVTGSLDDADVKKANIAFILGSGLIPEFSPSFVSNCADYLQDGGFLYIDNCYFKSEYPFHQLMEALVVDVQKKLKGKVEWKNLNMNHPLFQAPAKIAELPLGYDHTLKNIEHLSYLHGLFLDAKLVLLLSTKGYPVVWSGENNLDDSKVQFDFGMNVLLYTLNKK